MWEYRIYDLNGNPNLKDGSKTANCDAVDSLNYLGQQGWELCGVGESTGGYGGPRFYFKRPITHIDRLKEVPVEE